MLKDAFIRCRDALMNGGIENADFEARCMLEHLTGYGRAAQLAHGGEPFDKMRELENMTARRLKHEPLQYILGKWSFCGFDFAVGDGVLIPRDDTEVALGLCLDYLRGKKSARAIDLCSGSGAIAVSLERLTGCHMTAVELSEKAFYFLQRSIELNQSAVIPIKNDVMSCFLDFEDDIFDLIVSNPPYIRSADLPTLQKEVQFEPAMALDGGASGFDFYEAILRNWTQKLRHGGAMVFELGENQAAYVAALMRKQGFDKIRTELDFGETERAIIGIRQ